MRGRPEVLWTIFLGGDARHVRPELPGRAHRDGQVDLQRRRQHLRAVQYRARARVGGVARGAGRGRQPGPGPGPSWARRPCSLASSRRRRRSRRVSPLSSWCCWRRWASSTLVCPPGDGELLGSACRRPGAAWPGHGPVHAGLAIGGTPVGAPIVGAVTSHYGARAGMLLCGAVPLLAAAVTARGTVRAQAPPPRPRQHRRGAASRHTGRGHPLPAATTRQKIDVQSRDMLLGPA